MRRSLVDMDFIDDRAWRLIEVLVAHYENVRAGEYERRRIFAPHDRFYVTCCEHAFLATVAEFLQDVPAESSCQTISGTQSTS